MADDSAGRKLEGGADLPAASKAELAADGQPDALPSEEAEPPKAPAGDTRDHKVVDLEAHRASTTGGDLPPKRDRAEDAPGPAGGLTGLRALMGGGGRGADDCLTAEQLSALRTRTTTKSIADATVAEEVAAALRLGQGIRTANVYVENAFERLGFVLAWLLQDPPQLVLAKDERLNMQIELYRRSGGIRSLLARLSSGSSTGLVLAALLLSLAIWSGGIYLIQIFLGSERFSGVAGDIFFMHGGGLSVITSAAFLGGVFSIATRLQEFSRIRDLDPFAMFFTALLKPLVGVVLALFLFALLVGEVVGIGFLGADPLQLRATPQPEAASLGALSPKNMYVLWVLGFLAGFSERFAWDFVDRAQGLASGGADSKDGKPADPSR